MAIQMRRGNAANYDEDKMLPGEFGVATDEKELYIAFGSGDSKRVLTEDDIQEIDNSLDANSENPVQNKIVKTALDAKAPIASPTFTGTPKAPTAAAGTNNTQIATTAFVQQEAIVKNIWTGTCTTSRSTAVKVVTLDNAEGFSLTNGVIICVGFSSGNAVTSPKLNVNGTGEIDICYSTMGVQYPMSEAPFCRWGPGVVFFRYSNSKWYKASADMGHIKYFEDNKADLYSPTFTGQPKTTTPSDGDNSTRIASTAFVQNAISASEKSLTATDRGSGVIELSLT